MIGASAVLVALVVACTSGSDGAGGVDDGGEGPLDPVGDKVDLSEPGFHELPRPPIAERTSYVGGDGVVVWTGRELVVWGGVAADSASEPGRSLGDGASLDPDEGRWRPLPPSPFPDGLYRPLGAWDGTEVIVIGTWCDAEIPPVTDGSPPPCPEGPAAAAYDPVAASWRQLDPPPIPVDQWSGQPVIALGPTAAVGGDDSARFAFGWSGDAIVWDRDEGWSAVGSAVDGDAVNIRLCADAVRHAISAVILPQPGVDVPSPARTLGPDTAGWSEEVDLGVPVEEHLTCGDGLAVGVRSDDPAIRGQGYDLRTGEAVPLVEPPSSIGFFTPLAAGPWLVVDQTPMGAEVDGMFVRRYAVRRWADAPNDLVEVETPLDESVDVSSAIALEGVGLVGGEVAVPRARPLVLWRLPEELTS